MCGRCTPNLKKAFFQSCFISGRKKSSKSECSQTDDSDVEAVIKQSQESHSLEDLSRYSW